MVVVVENVVRIERKNGRGGGEWSENREEEW